ncbi:MAG: LysR family transcriptional regulator [Shewanella sp.]|nr:MAG: LysR family transcriptional regulator [Shewanella sp.]
MSELNLEISWLRSFVTVAKTGSMTEAAKILYRSQSAISMHIKNIEDTLGRAVFSRGSRRLSLNASGQELLVHAQKILYVYRNSMRELMGSDVQGHISLGIPDDYAMAYLPALLSIFSEKYPSIEITLCCEPSSQLIPKIAANELDIAVITQDKVDRGEPLFSEELVWVGKPSQQIWNRSPLPVAMYEFGSQARAKIVDKLESLSFGYRIVYNSPNIAGQLAAVESGMAIAVLTRCSVPAHLQVLNNSRLPKLPALDVGVITSQAVTKESLVHLLYDEIVSILKKET